MSTPLKVVPIPTSDISDVARGLRSLADAVERGDYQDAHNLAWVIDGGNGRIDIGMLGRAPEPAATAYFLYGLAKRRLEDGAIG